MVYLGDSFVIVYAFTCMLHTYHLWLYTTYLGETVCLLITMNNRNSIWSPRLRTYHLWLYTLLQVYTTYQSRITYLSTAVEKVSVVGIGNLDAKRAWQFGHEFIARRGVAGRDICNEKCICTVSECRRLTVLVLEATSIGSWPFRLPHYLLPIHCIFQIHFILHITCTFHISYHIYISHT